MKQANDPKPAVRLTNSGKKFSVTIQVPEDVAAQWPEWFSTDKLTGEVFKAAAVTGAPARARLLSRLTTLAVLVLIVELFIGGLALGYFASSWLRRPQSASPGAVPAVTGEETADAPASGPAVPTPADAPPAGSSAVQAPVATPPSAAAGPGATAGSTAASAGSTAAPASEPARPATRFRVQVGAYRIEANARAVVGRLRDQGYRADVRTYGGLYLVQVGSFASRADAAKLAQDLQRLGYETLIIP
ncbi:MAG: SPOR domain-containing protein [Armatimonadota bacterium]|nr:SPOR domain-containing protein [Armatimonadota bacterium]MDR7452298.1 SPOR domain-containing protein [Armatimonadota bacterium]MDR7467939.1 SPOR domain-containing protein [Armatimonadota bacterium]MDR7494781.1 SPOR domain-containing protein [Armatimonadota bacterium]MDR7499265.1 SPOR domain-containing protein [Armatimonadota bacterium]